MGNGAEVRFAPYQFADVRAWSFQSARDTELVSIRASLSLPGRVPASLVAPHFSSLAVTRVTQLLSYPTGFSSLVCPLPEGFLESQLESCCPLGLKSWETDPVLRIKSQANPSFTSLPTIPPLPGGTLLGWKVR